MTGKARRGLYGFTALISNFNNQLCRSSETFTRKKSVKGPKSHRLSRAMAGRDDWHIKRTGKLVRTEDSEKNLRQWLWTKGGTRRKGWGRGILSFTFSSTPHLPWRLSRRLPKGDLTITDKQMKATLTLIILNKLLKASEPLTQFFFKRGTYVCNLHPYLPLGERRSSPSLHRGSISPSPRNSPISQLNCWSVVLSSVRVPQSTVTLETKNTRDHRSRLGSHYVRSMSLIFFTTQLTKAVSLL